MKFLASLKTPQRMKSRKHIVNWQSNGTLTRTQTTKIELRPSSRKLVKLTQCCRIKKNGNNMICMDLMYLKLGGQGVASIQLLILVISMLDLGSRMLKIFSDSFSEGEIPLLGSLMMMVMTLGLVSSEDLTEVEVEEEGRLIWLDVTLLLASLVEARWEALKITFLVAVLVVAALEMDLRNSCLTPVRAVWEEWEGSPKVFLAKRSSGMAVV
mmetsp:Transcript_9378/g.10253  ORF Transcript_9378/g.10253 Transcript_9378/m.10253 type:complete len:212 (-) Transcript_9378:136-771(-)